MVARAQQPHANGKDGRHTGGHANGRFTTLHGGKTLFKGPHRGVGES